jgi:hypothetical protein
MEEWKIIEDYPNYAVSNLGQIKSLKYDRIVKGGKNNCGYFYVNLVRDKIPKTHAVHKLVMKYFGENEPENSIIDHIDHDKTNNKINNLQWLSIRENTEKYYGNFDKKKEIVRLYEQGKSIKDIIGLVELGDTTVRLTLRKANMIA